MKEILNILLLLLLAFQDGTAIPSGKSLSPLARAGIALIPYPDSVELKGEPFIFSEKITICTGPEFSPEDLFAAEELKNRLGEEWGIRSSNGNSNGEHCIKLKISARLKALGEEGYKLEADPSGITVSAWKSPGLFYGVQTLLQVIQEDKGKILVRGMKITDSPDIPFRAVHYDTKHFQERKEYVFGFIRTLARYKINVLVWEWEDKFAYRSHPEIGAPGAFTMEEMQDFTRFARKYHIQIVPLVQGLGHVSYILKHPEFRNLREIDADNWGFCPLKEGTYTLMTDLLREAAEATPGSKYIHIGCDETYVLGKGVSCGCSEKAARDGSYSLMMTYINRIGEEVKKFGRIPISWDGGYNPDERTKPVRGLFTPGGFNRRLDSASLSAGYPLYIYDPNPGIEHLFLPYFYREGTEGPIIPHLLDSYNVLTTQVNQGGYSGVISTSWNCSGVHNQVWMLRYITAAEYSWNGHGPSPEEFADTYFLNYYGPGGKDIKELFILLNKASYFYMNAFERKVWHWGEIGKTHLPDLPRDDMEFDPFWNTQYSKMVAQAAELVPRMDRVLAICTENSGGKVRNAYDFELFSCIAGLFRHTARTYLMLSELEKTVKRAADFHFTDNRAALDELEGAAEMISRNIAERDSIFDEIQSVWEKSQFPRGLSSPDKKYLHARDQQRNFANRRPDLTFMICDEQDLGLENYLSGLHAYMAAYKKKYLGE